MNSEIEFLFEFVGNMKYWRIETWSLIVAAVALMQPWIVSWLKVGKVEIYETGLPEIGYSSYGATIGLYGTLRSHERDLFIRSADLEVTRLSDNSSRKFDWIAFRPLTTIVGRVLSELEVTLPSGFMLLTSQPHQYNIMFSDPVLREEIQTILRIVQDKWLATLKASSTISELVSKPQEPEKLRILLAQAAQPVFSAFARTPDYASAESALRSLAFWDQGTYKITLRVQIATPDRAYKKSWIIELSEADKEGLALNSSKILQELCTESLVPHYFAFPQYRPDNLATKLAMSRK